VEQCCARGECGSMSSMPVSGAGGRWRSSDMSMVGALSSPPLPSLSLPGAATHPRRGHLVQLQEHLPLQVMQHRGLAPQLGDLCREGAKDNARQRGVQG